MVHSRITMYILFKEFHSVSAYLVLAILLFAIIYHAYSWAIKKPFSKLHKTSALVAMMAVHTQFLVGLVLYFLSPLGLSNFSGAAMKVAITRLFIVEHPLVMFLAIALITIGYSKANNATKINGKYKMIVVFYSIGLLCILSRIPWSMWI